MREKIALLILRVSLGAVFLIFGIGKLQNDFWAETIRSMDFFQKLPLQVDLSVYLIGIMEIITGAALILGFFRRLAAALAAFQLTAILMLLRFQEIRDIGLLGAALYMIFSKENSWGIDYLIKKVKTNGT